MEKISTVCNGTYYHQNDGFFYRKDKQRRFIMYLQCKEARTAISCRARGKSRVQINENGVEIVDLIQFTYAVHNHPPDLLYEERNKFNQACKKRAVEDTTNLKAIWSTEAEKYNIEVTANYPFVTAEKRMAYNRSKSRPRIPQTLEELGHCLRGRQGAPFATCLKSDQQFFRRATAEFIIFISPRTAGLLGENHLTTMDGTFKVLPKKPKSYQLLTIAVIKRKILFPVCYVIMTGKTAEMYINVFNEIRILYPQWQPQHILCDFEGGLHRAIEEIFPQCVIKGCWFHFSQAILKNIKNFGLWSPYRRDDTIKKVVKMLMALALLPQNCIVQGYANIKQFCRINDIHMVPEIVRMFTYMENQWMTRIEKFSVYRQEHRTNNHHEGLHSHISTSMSNARGACRINIWAFLRGLQRLEHEFAAKLITLERGSRVQKPPRKSWQRHDQQIRMATDQLDNQLISIWQFLRICGHHAYRGNRAENNQLMDIFIEEIDIMEAAEGMEEVENDNGKPIEAEEDDPEGLLIEEIIVE